MWLQITYGRILSQNHYKIEPILKAHIFKWFFTFQNIYMSNSVTSRIIAVTPCDQQSGSVSHVSLA